MKTIQKELRYRLPLNLQLFAEESGGEESGGSGGDPKTYTEEEVKAKLKEERKSAAESAIKKRFGDLADMDIEEIRAAVELKRKSDEENKGSGSNPDPEDIDKRVEALLKDREKEQNQKTFTRLLNAEVKVFANELEFADWEDARKLADLTQVKENEQGELEGVKEALEALAEKKPHLLKSKPSKGVFGSNIPQGAGGKPLNGYDAGKSIAEQRNQKGSDKK